MSRSERGTGGKTGPHFMLSDCSERGLQATVERSVLLNSERIWIQRHFIYLYLFSFQRSATPTTFCLFSLQLALILHCILPFHCSALLATLAITEKSLECQRSSRSEVNTKMRTEMGSPEAPRQTEHSKHCFLQGTNRSTGLNKELPEPQCLAEISSLVQAQIDTSIRT